MPIMMATSVNMICSGASMMPRPTMTELTMPSLRITSWMANVRISKLVQNGMVMRNSQMSRQRSLRVAMK